VAGSGIRVCLELGERRTFASAIDWPGWCRSAGGEEQALETLRSYAPRYAPVARAAELQLPDPTQIEVVERLPGSVTTSFGTPGAIAGLEREPLTAAEAEQMTRLLRACWELLDRVTSSAPATLRKGPRGGGRDRDAILEHVLGAEADAYARKLGLRLPHPALDDIDARQAQRDAISQAIQAAAGQAAGNGKLWPPRYAARRIGWHVLDHAWEIQDRSGPAAIA